MACAFAERSVCAIKPKFHYADFPETSPDGVMEFGLKGTSRVCRGRHREVGIVEFGLYGPHSTSSHRAVYWAAVHLQSSVSDQAN